jgi:hypothetical protein
MDYAQRVRQDLSVRCVWLRTKKSYFPLPQAGDEANPVPTACWWCLKTNEALGPDGSSSGPGVCDTPGRACYAGPVRL